MNKRKYPYGIDMCPQLKIHIGEKQVANGVLGPSKMSEIYGKNHIIVPLIDTIIYYLFYVLWCILYSSTTCYIILHFVANASLQMAV